MHFALEFLRGRFHGLETAEVESEDVCFPSRRLLQVFDSILSCVGMSCAQVDRRIMPEKLLDGLFTDPTRASRHEIDLRVVVTWQSAEIVRDACLAAEIWDIIRCPSRLWRKDLRQDTKEHGNADHDGGGSKSS